MNTSAHPLIADSTPKRSLPLFALFFTLTVPAVVTAQFVHIIENGTVTITGYVGDAGAMVIPDMHFGRPVTRIGPRAFNGRFDLTSVSFPESVTSIGERAFSLCMDLASIEFGGGLTSIDNLAFSGCFSLTNVEMPDSVRTIGYGAFDSCTNLTSVTLGTNLSSIADYTFSRCSSLSEVILPVSVSNVGIGAFGECTDLAKITMGSNVTNIGNYAFAACASLRNFSLGKSVLSVGVGAFIDCTSLIAFEVDAENGYYNSQDGVLFNEDLTSLVSYPGGKAGSYAIPASVTTLAERAFSGAHLLDGVTIPDSVTNIPRRTFSDCNRLAAVSIPDSVTSMGEQAFSQCSGLADLNLGSGLTTISSCTFQGCTSLASVIVPDTMKSIDEGALAHCTALVEISLGSGVQELHPYAFHDSTRLIRIDVSALNPIYSSRDGVVFDKSQTELVLCPPGQPGSYVIPEHVTRIGQGAFLGCIRLRSIVLPASVTTFGDSALGTDSLENVYFLGDAPAPVSNLFDYRAPVTVYYLPSATGWGASYSSKRTSIWTNPAILEGSVTVDGSGFGFTMAWAPDTSVLVEVSPAPADPGWTPLSTHLLIGGVSQYRDIEPTAKPSRFYRLRAL